MDNNTKVSKNNEAFDVVKIKLLEDKEKLNHVVNYEIGKVPTTVEQFNFKPSISELSKSIDKDIVEATIFSIAGKYLNANVKGRSITDKFTVDMLIEYFMTECGNLELQEIEFIFKSGIMGKYGIIYNDISIDTICGTDGWVGKYYANDRKKRKENTYVEKIELTGKEITYDQFLENHPELKERNELLDLLSKAKKQELTLDDVKRFYTIKGFDKNTHMKEDMLVMSKEYYRLSTDIRSVLTENKYILNEFCKFVINNYNKVKG